MRLCITGPRDLWDESLASFAIAHLRCIYPISELLHGGATGVDSICKDIMSKDETMKVIQHKADWSRYGKAAGPMRSREMVDSADILLAITRGSEPDSPGTRACYEYALRKGRLVYIAWRSNTLNIERRM